MSGEDRSPRCVWCHKLLAVMLTRPWQILCGRCKTLNDSRKRPS